MSDNKNDTPKIDTEDFPDRPFYGGTKRVNKLPMVLAGCGVLGFALMIACIASQRVQHTLKEDHQISAQSIAEELMSKEPEASIVKKPELPELPPELPKQKPEFDPDLAPKEANSTVQSIADSAQSIAKGLMAKAERFMAKQPLGVVMPADPYPQLPNSTVRVIAFDKTERPKIVCAVQDACDIALQDGEKVNAIKVGNTALWDVHTILSGSTEHLIIKPLAVDTETSMVIATNRRVYHLFLQSPRPDSMPFVSFSYPKGQ